MRYSFVFFVLGIFLFLSCQTDENENYLYMQSDKVVMISNGKVYEKFFDDFKLRGDSLVFCDTITLDDAVQTYTTGFKYPQFKEVLSSRKCGDYEIRKCIYQSAFYVLVSSYVHEVYYRSLEFEFEAEEIWLDGEIVFKQPYNFCKRNTYIEKIPIDDEFFKAKYILDFNIAYYNMCRIEDGDLGYFNYRYNVIRSQESVWNDSGNDFTVSVTYDYHPD